jgi:hypothetical protein
VHPTFARIPGAWKDADLEIDFLTSVLKVKSQKSKVKRKKRRLTFILGCEGSSWGVLHLPDDPQGN